jgi:hypothetical protein
MSKITTPEKPCLELLEIPWVKYAPLVVGDQADIVVRLRVGLNPEFGGWVISTLLAGWW